MSIKFVTPVPKRVSLAAAVLTVYYFDMDDSEQAAQHAAIVAARRAAGKTVWTNQAPYSHDKQWTAHRDAIDAAAGRPKTGRGERGQWSAPIAIELQHVFDNQMNSAPPLNARLFDWSEIVYENKKIKHGYWIESAELQHARATTCACGYCGAQYENATPGDFCGACLESEYLTRNELHLLRLRLVADSKANRAPLSPEELAEVLPVFEEARIKGTTARGIARRAKQRADVAAKYEKAIKTATTERDAHTWLLDRGFDLSNVIYYSHTDKFAFGWRSHIDGAELEHLRATLADFPFNFEINPKK